MAFDLLLKGGHLIDPENNIDGPRDLAVAQGKVAAVDAEIPADQAGQVIDVSGLYVVPGLVDIHAHMYATPGHRRAWAGDNSVLPDGFSFRSGVTTMVDTGSSGWRNLEDFRFRVIDRFHTRIFAFVNIVGLGMVANDIEQIADLVARDVVISAQKRLDDGVVISPATLRVITRFHAKVVEAMQGVVAAIKADDPERARAVREMKVEVRALAHKAALHGVQRLTAKEPRRVKTYAREVELIEILDDIFRLARRVARAVAEGRTEAAPDAAEGGEAPDGPPDSPASENL